MPRNPYYDAKRSHHRPDGFQNNYLEFVPKTLADVLRWRWDATRRGLPLPPSTPIPFVQPDLAFIASNAMAGAGMEPAVTWIGHATVLAQLGGLLPPAVREVDAGQPAREDTVPVGARVAVADQQDGGHVRTLRRVARRTVADVVE